MKKLVVIGRGTAGAISAAHFNRWLPKNEWLIEWHFDSSIPTQAVGEGTNLLPPMNLYNTIGFNFCDLDKIDGTLKTGIFKKNWGESGSNFIHTFQTPNVAMHINAIKLQNYIFEYLKNNSNIKIIEKNSNAFDLDADYIVDCSGKPSKEKLEKDFVIANHIPVNAVHVTQCFWDHPKFNYSLTNAAKYGWYFGIPLQNRCAIGYLYNRNLNTLDEIKNDTALIIDELGLTASDKTNSFHFENYYRKQNFVNNVAFNGNASLFLEPLEATTIGNICLINIMIVNLLDKKHTQDYYNEYYLNNLEEISAMISMHYYSGSIYKTEFWKNAKDVCETYFRKKLNESETMRFFINEAINSDLTAYSTPKYKTKEYGTWIIESFRQNINGLGIKQKLMSDLNDL